MFSTEPHFSHWNLCVLNVERANEQNYYDKLNVKLVIKKY